jgi:hypothetical protein
MKQNGTSEHVALRCVSCLPALCSSSDCSWKLEQLQAGTPQKWSAEYSVCVCSIHTYKHTYKHTNSTNPQYQSLLFRASLQLLSVNRSGVCVMLPHVCLLACLLACYLTTYAKRVHGWKDGTFKGIRRNNGFHHIFCLSTVAVAVAVAVVVVTMEVTTVVAITRHAACLLACYLLVQ